MPIGDSTPTSRWPRTVRFVRTCRGTVLQYVENKVPLALKRSVAAHRFLKKIFFNEGHLSGPKVCRSNLETPCILQFPIEICLDEKIARVLCKIKKSMINGCFSLQKFINILHELHVFVSIKNIQGEPKLLLQKIW